jgi:hypothetical protein
MRAFLLSVHVVFAILFVGPPAVAVSLFPRFVPATATSTPRRNVQASATSPSQTCFTA